MSKVKEVVKAQLAQRLDFYLTHTNEKDLIEVDGGPPIWAVLCDLYDLIADCKFAGDFTISIRNGKITNSKLNEVYNRQNKPEHRLAPVFDKIKGQMEG